MGEGAITGISLDVTSLMFSADPALTKNSFGLVGALQISQEGRKKGKRMYIVKMLMNNVI